jgi:hypothetical protein
MTQQQIAAFKKRCDDTLSLMAKYDPENLVRRINRGLKPYGAKLRKTRGVAQQAELGEWYLYDTDLDVVRLPHVNIERLDTVNPVADILQQEANTWYNAETAQERRQ